MVNVAALRIAILTEYKNMAEFCEAAGIPRATLDNIMKERCEPQRATIQAICDALHSLDDGKKYRIFFA